MVSHVILAPTREFFQTKISVVVSEMKWNRKFRAEELKVYDVHESKKQKHDFYIKYYKLEKKKLS